MEIIVIDRFWLTILAILAAILDSEKAMRAKFQPYTNNYWKCKEMIVNRPNKLFKNVGHATGLQWVQY